MWSFIFGTIYLLNRINNNVWASHVSNYKYVLDILAFNTVFNGLFHTLYIATLLIVCSSLIYCDPHFKSYGIGYDLIMIEKQIKKLLIKFHEKYKNLMIRIDKHVSRQLAKNPRDMEQFEKWMKSLEKKANKIYQQLNKFEIDKKLAIFIKLRENAHKEMKKECNLQEKQVVAQPVQYVYPAPQLVPQNPPSYYDTYSQVEGADNSLLHQQLNASSKMLANMKELNSLSKNKKSSSSFMKNLNDMLGAKKKSS